MTRAMEWLYTWFSEHCDGDWEHQYGITIKTIDNPGWSLVIDLAWTNKEGASFQPVYHNVAPSEPEQGGSGLGTWYLCKARSDQFIGYCGVNDLDKIVSIFRSWVES